MINPATGWFEIHQDKDYNSITVNNIQYNINGFLCIDALDQ